jgi:enoyl-CoA hydratase/carnithine racemase
MSYNTLKYEVADRVLTLTLNRPEALNAFTVEMAHELIAAFERASEDDEVGAVIVTGEGRAFCAGMDLSSEGNVFGLDETQSPTLSDMTERLEDPAIRDGVRDTGGRVTLAIYNCKKPVIAAIGGHPFSKVKDFLGIVREIFGVQCLCCWRIDRPHSNGEFKII